MDNVLLAKLNSMVNPVCHEIDFNVGDTITVHIVNKSKDKRYTQRFTGEVISINGRKPFLTFLVRKVVKSHAIEISFPNTLPEIEQIVVVTRRRMRRAKLYYLRELRFKTLRSSLMKRQVSRINMKTAKGPKTNKIKQTTKQKSDQED